MCTVWIPQGVILDNAQKNWWLPLFQNSNGCFFPTSDEWVMPVSCQRTPRTEAAAGQPQVGLFILSLSVSQYVSNYRDIEAKSHHAGFTTMTYENVQIHKSAYTWLYNTQVQTFKGTCACWYHFVFTYTIHTSLQKHPLFALPYILQLYV